MQDRDKLESELLELRTVVDALDGSLRRLAMGDVYQQIDHPFPRGYDGLRKDFNRGLASVSATIDAIITRTKNVRLESSELRLTLKQKAEEESERDAALSALVAEAGSIADTARSQAAHVEHVSTILHNARLDMRRPKEAAARSVERTEMTCRSLAHLKRLTDEVKALLREASLLALNGGINAAHTGPEGEEALDAAKSLHSLTRQVGSTIEALGEAADCALADAHAAAEAGTQVTREFDAMDLYTEALDAQIGSLSDSTQQHATDAESIRGGLNELARARRPLDPAQPSPEFQLSNIDRALAVIEHQTSRFTPVRTILPPPPAPTTGTGGRSHLRLVKS
ncbi:methyl-accepting chemotaxis protein [Pseudorhizobium tarimense]|uniref:Methyl-accepting chemotaxis protein n=1 Tax=Pseudorhizobium tarimense TaxID=1079109 RepID=A0ABV2H7Q1_9HYPH|nr:methyl-accepting chemotaxis protein [Pseudorhizobium tarimense]MCJ8519591.1 methyl-accepting chemotaxis protein [Pseudorhizobium tarimense]